MRQHEWGKLPDGAFGARFVHVEGHSQCGSTNGESFRTAPLALALCMWKGTRNAAARMGKASGRRLWRSLCACGRALAMRQHEWGKLPDGAFGARFVHVEGHSQCGSTNG